MKKEKDTNIESGQKVATILKNKYFICCLIAFVIWIITYKFEIKPLAGFQSWKLRFVTKIFQFVYLYGITYKIIDLIEKRKDKKGKLEIIVFLVLFALLLVSLLMAWPGTWSWDDVFIYKNAIIYKLFGWQHFITSLFFIECLLTFPFAAGIIFIQLLLIALISAYCIANIVDRITKTKNQRIALTIVLSMIVLLPPVLTYALSGFRMGLYSFVELLLITKLFIVIIDKKKIDIWELVKITICTILVASWRTEGLYYPILILLLSFILGKEIIKKKTAIIVFIITMISCFLIGKYNSHLNDNTNYSITATMEPVTQIVKLNKEEDKEDLEIVNKIFDVNYVQTHPDMTGEEYYWDANIMKQYSKEEYSDYMKTYLKLIIKHPKVAFNSFWNIFYDAGSGMGRNGKQTTRNVILGSGNTLYLVKGPTKWKNIPGVFKYPINDTLRKSFITLICGVNLEGDINIIHILFWNMFIPIIVSICLSIHKLIKKDWLKLFLLVIVLIRLPLVFITAPAPYFMYYLSIYLCGYFLSSVYIFEILVNIKDKKIKRTTTK